MTKEEKLARKQQRKAEKVGLGKLLLWNSSSCSVALSTLMLGYVTFYCTDVLQLAPALVGTLFMVSKIFDSFTDIVAGFIVDRTQTRWGKGRPYEIFMLFLWLSTWLLFSCPTSFATAAKCIWIFCMLTVEQTYPAVVPGAQTAKGTGFEGHAFFEASSIRKVGDKYYFIYSSELSHELCYAVSDSPCRGFVYGGTLVDNADLGLCDTARYFTGNNHGSIEQINGRWYVFYHRHTNSSMFCRQGMVEPIEILPDGRIPQVEITTSGPNGTPLPAVELRELPAYAACNLYMTQPPQVNAEAGQNPFPYITQDGADVMPESESKPEAYICNLTPGTVVGFKYLNFQNVTKVSVKTRGMCYYGGFDVLLTADGEPIGTVSAARGNEWRWQTTELAIPDGISAIYFRMKGYGTLSLAAAKFH